MQTPWWKEPTRGQWAAFTAAWAGWVLDAFDFTIFLMVQKHIADEFGVGIVALSGSVTLTLLVRLAGGFAGRVIVYCLVHGQAAAFPGKILHQAVLPEREDRALRRVGPHGRGDGLSGLPRE